MENPFPVNASYPQWPRVSHMEKVNLSSSYQNNMVSMPSEGEVGLADTDTNIELEQKNMQQNMHTQYLEKSLDFLRKQHADMLTSLQKEIEKLRKENRDLQFHLTVLSKGSSSLASLPPISSNESQSRHNNNKSKPKDNHIDNTDELIDIEEVARLREKLAEEVEKNQYLQKQLDEQNKRLQNENKPRQLKRAKQKATLTSQLAAAESVAACSDELLIDNLRVLFNPLRIVSKRVLGGNPDPRAPGLSECEMVIKQLYSTTEKQALELRQLRSDLRDMAYRGNWQPQRTPTSRLPLLSPTPQERRPPQQLLLTGENLVHLPALPSASGARAVERRRRTHILRSQKQH